MCGWAMSQFFVFHFDWNALPYFQHKYLAPAKAEVVGRLEWENPVSRKGTRLGKQADIILAEQVRLAY